MEVVSAPNTLDGGGGLPMDGGGGVPMDGGEYVPGWRGLGIPDGCCVLCHLVLLCGQGLASEGPVNTKIIVNYKIGTLYL